jgi:predicted dehydrogenase
MHTLLFLDPGHFHAALTLRVPHRGVSEEIVVYAPEEASADGGGAELRDFLGLMERFNTRDDGPTGWKPVVVTARDPLGRLVEERRGDIVVLAGKNGGKARTMRRLHDAGFHVLADKPWLVEPDDRGDIEASLSDWPLVVEIMTGRHDLASRLLTRLVSVPEVFGAWRDETPVIELDSVHHLEKLVDGAPLRRPWWFFDVRVQGSGPVDIPTHLVDQTQWLAESLGGAPGVVPELVEARAWSTRVPVDAFCRITGAPAVPRSLASRVDGDALSYRCNAELRYRLGAVTARASTRWDLAPPPGGGDTYRTVAHGTRADVAVEQGPHTGHRRRVFVEPRVDVAGVGRSVDAVVATWENAAGRLSVDRGAGGRRDITIPPGLDGGHETHFARVLDDLLAAIDEHRWPDATARRTGAKYALLAAAARATSA